MMFRTLSLLFVFLFLASCGKGGGGGSSSDTAAAVSLDEISTESAVPSAALSFHVNLKLQNFSGNQESKVLEAAELIKQVVASDEFKNKILNHKYKGKKTFVDNGGLSNAQIYKKILEGSERLNPGIDNKMDLDLMVYSDASNTVGYTYPDVERVWMNSKFLNQNIPAEVTTNMMHEWLHKIGFKHEVKATPSRPYSVPYAVGYIVRSLAKRLD